MSLGSPCLIPSKPCKYSLDGTPPTPYAPAIPRWLLPSSGARALMERQGGSGAQGLNAPTLELSGLEFGSRLYHLLAARRWSLT